MVKRLKCIGQCLEELSALGITGTDETNPASNYSKSDLGSDGKLALRPLVSAEAVRVGRKFQRQFLQELLGLMARPGEALRHHSAWYGPPHLSSWYRTSVSLSFIVTTINIYIMSFLVFYSVIV